MLEQLQAWLKPEPLEFVVDPTQPVVRFAQVDKSYANGVIGLKSLNLQVNMGEFLFITGHSGSGKSTLLKLIYGEEKPTAGEVWVLNTCLNSLKGDRLAKLRRRIGVVFQDYKLVEQRTVAENVAFVLMAQGYNRGEIQAKLTPVLDRVGLAAKADCFPAQLSGGEQQRVSIARAIVNSPPLLLADEPTGNLDLENAWLVVNIFKQLNATGMTVLITTHDQDLVEAAAHPAIALKAGCLVG
ncbi:MAG: cell division ATP-binding protein FtsE [Pseudanabaenaceae cyanobacterium bins.68]|nr:cell division ATP-binding protein FtsE [Pseudanabaenaceae cyanobacterium bins.68]